MAAQMTHKQIEEEESENWDRLRIGLKVVGIIFFFVLFVIVAANLDFNKKYDPVTPAATHIDHEP